MGIDIYARWKGQTRRERKAQVTGFSTIHGHVGYLREAYHGGPYVTRFLVREAFEAADAEAAIAAADLRTRLPLAVLMALFRHAKVYGDDEPGRRKLFVDGEGDVPKAIAALYAPGGEIDQARKGDEGDHFARHVPKVAIQICCDAIAARMLPEFALAFVDFVDLCERMEVKTGEPCRIVASY